MSSLNQLLDQTEELLLSQLQAASAYHKEAYTKLKSYINDLTEKQHVKHYEKRADAHKQFAESIDRAILIIQKASQKGDRNEQ